MASFEPPADEALALKEAGNALFAKADLEPALEKWLAALVLLQQREPAAATDEVMAKILTNRALALLKLRPPRADEAVPPRDRSRPRRAGAAEAAAHAAAVGTAADAAAEDEERAGRDALQRDPCGGQDPLELVGEAPSPHGDARATASSDGNGQAVAASARYEAEGDHERSAACDLRRVSSQLALAAVQRRVYAAPTDAEFAAIAKFGPADEGRRRAAELMERAMEECRALGDAHFSRGDFALAGPAPESDSRET
ncbi:hypothetical protein JL722_6986 [Aureococcus anophagefferens]|nr:hypothetical protein JL722_6986 [Aureococcus anophagefferens]